MQEWKGVSLFREIQEGTAIMIYMDGQPSGKPRPVLPSSTNIQIELSGTFLDARLTNVTRAGGILETPDGRRWSISPKRPDELGSGSSIRGMYTEDWIVRGQL